MEEGSLTRVMPGPTTPRGASLPPILSARPGHGVQVGSKEVDAHSPVSRAQSPVQGSIPEP